MKLEDIRRDYLKGGLNRADLAENPITQLDIWLQQAIEAELSADPTAMVLATVDADGQPSQRIVLLKHLDEQGLVFYTNYDSQKGQQIAANPKVSIHFPWTALERQVIVYGKAEKISQEDSRAYFESRPRASQIAAWTSKQSKPVESRAALDAAFLKTEEGFGNTPIPLPEFWGGYRVVPNKVEFWQGRSGRLHDRFLYQQSSGGWDLKRLQP